MQNWTQRPNNEYQLAYDLCALHASHAKGEVALIASSPFHARELVSRLPDAQLVAAPHWTAPPDDSLNTVDLHDLSGVGCIIWAEPTLSQVSQVTSTVERVLASGGVLCVLVSGRLARRLSEWREHRAPALDPAETALGWRKTEQLIFQPGHYTIRQRVAFRGLTALAWDYAGQIAARLGRDDLADRCGVAMRASFTASARSFSTIGVIVAEKRQRP